MIQPSELEAIELEKADLAKMESEIDDSIRKYHGWYPWETAILEGEYPVSVRNEIGKKYKQAGWNFVYHQTSSENGEMGGLTCFLLSTREIEKKYVEKYYKV